MSRLMNWALIFSTFSIVTIVVWVPDSVGEVKPSQQQKSVNFNLNLNLRPRAAIRVDAMREFVVREASSSSSSSKLLVSSAEFGLASPLGADYFLAFVFDAKQLFSKGALFNSKALVSEGYLGVNFSDLITGRAGIMRFNAGAWEFRRSEKDHYATSFFYQAFLGRYGANDATAEMALAIAGQRFVFQVAEPYRDGAVTEQVEEPPRVRKSMMYEGAFVGGYVRPLLSYAAIPSGPRQIGSAMVEATELFVLAGGIKLDSKTGFDAEIEYDQVSLPAADSAVITVVAGQSQVDEVAVQAEKFASKIGEMGYSASIDAIRVRTFFKLANETREVFDSRARFVTSSLGWELYPRGSGERVRYHLAASRIQSNGPVEGNVSQPGTNTTHRFVVGVTGSL